MSHPGRIMPIVASVMGLGYYPLHPLCPIIQSPPLPPPPHPTRSLRAEKVGLSAQINIKLAIVAHMYTCTRRYLFNSIPKTICSKTDR